ncbi:MAG: PAS domain S-box protein [Synechococcales bacterium]|nr:PAS domain S-box protein [Synechococcales bacterium]
MHLQESSISNSELEGSDLDEPARDRDEPVGKAASSSSGTDFSWLVAKQEQRQRLAPSTTAYPEAPPATSTLHKLADLMNTAHFGIIEWDADLKIIYWSPIATQIFGYNGSEAIGQCLYDLINFEDPRQDCEAAWEGRSPLGDLLPTPFSDPLSQLPTHSNAGASAGQTTDNAKYHCTYVSEQVTKAGQTIVCEWHLQIYCERGSQSAGIAMVRDITNQMLIEQQLHSSQLELRSLSVAMKNLMMERQQAEQQLNASEQFLHQVLDGIPDPVFVKDEQHRWILLNRAACALLGHDRQDLLYRSERDILPPEEAAIAWDQDDLVLALRIATTNESYLTDATGKQRFLSTKRTLVEDAQGNPLIVGSIRDLSDRKQVEDALRGAESNSRQQTVQLSQALKNLKWAQTQLIQSEKMSSLGQLVAGVAHEINNPVNFIHGNITHAHQYAQELLNLVKLYQQQHPHPSGELQTLLVQADLDFLEEDLTKVLSSMQVGTERIQKIVRSLQTFSRMDEAEVKTVDIHEGIDSTLMLLQPRLQWASDEPNSAMDDSSHPDKPKIFIHRNYGQLPPVECFAGQINQVFMNVIVNAIDALEDGNFQLPEVAYDGLFAKKIWITTRQLDKNHIEIRIKDNGSGMNSEVQQHLFDPFFTTKPIGKGTGMGLSTSYQIITKHHGGSIECQSEIGTGAEFILRIPIRLPRHLCPTPMN